ncbi:MAG: c-type cytochrome biogenesis protein CcsB [Thermodesulfovibrionales bacterium]|nr:c-type cytochrome biogenesis protein CcsB [Thermodesulfovibrionales bacterium]
MKHLTDISIVFYLVAFVFSLLNVYKSTNKARFFFIASSGLAFLIHTFSIVIRYHDIGTIPITNMHESSSFFAWAIFVIYWYLYFRFRFIVLGTFILPIVVLLMFASSLLYTEIKGVRPELQSYWLIIHTLSAFTGNASFAVAAGIGVMYQLQERFLKKKKTTGLFNKLPSVQILDEINYRLITIGFPLHTLAIISGALWSENTFGIYWRWDPKEVWALISWLIYATILHLRLVKGWRGRKSAMLSIIGFFAVLFTFFGVNLLMESFHNF